MNTSTFETVYEKFQTDLNWLMSLILDPTGSRYLQKKSAEIRQKEFELQLSRTADFLAFIGHPEEKFKSIHIAGTSGKGSVTSMIAAILHSAHIRSGHHTSPYLQLPNEKLIADGKMISCTEFSALIDAFRQEYGRYLSAGRGYDHIKYGEAWVVITYLWFAMRQLEWGVVETGLGGRYDPTNVLPASLAVLTNIDYDHVESLGPDLERIAWHKAGIIKEKCLAITAERKPEILKVFKEEASKKQAQLFCIDEDFCYTVKEIDSRGSRIDVFGPYHDYKDVRINLQGLFQPINAALAISALDLLREQYQLPILTPAVQEGLNELVFPGRMEIMQEAPLVMIDGAHNQHKMAGLVNSLSELKKNKKLTVILGMLSTKDGGGMVETLLPVVDTWVATQPNVFGKPSTPAQELAEIIRHNDPHAMVRTAESVIEAVNTCLAEAGDDDLILVTGSLYMIGDARTIWHPKKEQLVGLETA